MPDIQTLLAIIPIIIWNEIIWIQICIYFVIFFGQVFQRLTAGSGHLILLNYWACKKLGQHKKAWVGCGASQENILQD